MNEPKDFRGISESQGVYSGKYWLFLRSVVIQGIGLVGLAVFLEGVRQIYPPASLVVGGASVVIWTILKVRE